MATFKMIMRTLSVLAAAYPTFDLKPETIKVYVRLLEDLPDSLIEQAAIAHIASSTFFPTVAELRKAALVLLDGQNPLPTALEAWSEVEEQVRRTGYLGKPSFSNPLITRTVSAIGWQNICRSENPVADRAHFLNGYAQLCERERNQMRLLPKPK
jgi:hypothetical protein